MALVFDLMGDETHPQAFSIRPAEVAVIQEKLQGDFEYLGYLGTVGYGLETRLHETDHRSDQEPGDGQEALETPGNRNVLRVEPDLFFGLPKRGFHRAGVTLLDSTAREAHLTGVVLQVVGALGEQQRQTLWALHQSQQHGRGAALLP